MFKPPLHMKRVPTIPLPEYVYLEAEGSIYYLTEQVNRLIKEGWTIDGDLVGTNGVFGQRMVKR